MSSDSPPPDFKTWTRWLAFRFGESSKGADSCDALAAARTARDEFGSAQTAVATAFQRSGAHRNIELLQVLAASTEEEASLPELITAQGFRVAFSRAADQDAARSSTGVFVQAPADKIAWVQGKSASVWRADERFELGRFDCEGKAFGSLPLGVHMMLSDFTSSTVRLEEHGPAEET